MLYPCVQKALVRDKATVSMLGAVQVCFTHPCSAPVGAGVIEDLSLSAEVLHRFDLFRNGLRFVVSVIDIDIDHIGPESGERQFQVMPHVFGSHSGTHLVKTPADIRMASLGHQYDFVSDSQPCDGFSHDPFAPTGFPGDPVGIDSRRVDEISSQLKKQRDQ